MPNSEALHFRRYGTTGPLVVLLHGGPGAPGSMAQLARCLSGDCRVWEPFQRESGGEPLTVARHVEDLRHLLDSADSPIHLVGSSWGAMLGLTFAARHPDGIAQLVIIGCGTFDKRSRAAYIERMQAGTTPADRARIVQLESALAAEPDPKRRNKFFSELGEIAFRTQSFDLIITDFETARVDERGFRETWSDAMRLQDEGVQPAEFCGIEASVLMLHGAEDPHPGAMIRDSLAPFVKDLEYHEFSRCGHEPWLERHAREDFLAVMLAAVQDV